MYKLLSLTLFMFVFVLDVRADICGITDDRVPSHDPKVGRLVKAGEQKGCGITLIGRKCAITIGECAENRDYAEFNVPAPLNGISQTSREKDIYFVKRGSAVFERNGIGGQWAVLQLEKNLVSNKYPGDVQGFYPVGTDKFKNNEPIRVVSYDVTQKVSYGKLVKAGIFLIPSIIEHDADTSIGSWGAPVISERTNEVVGINTHGGCKAVYVNPIGARFTNSGTSIFGSRKFRNAIASCLNN